MSRHAAIDYLRTPPGAPWRWEEGGRVLVWSDGTTILFREELDGIVERLAPGGLPAFPALVLLFAACRGKVPELSALTDATKEEPVQRVLQARQYQLTQDELKKLTQLPPELIARTAGKALLAEAVFELTTRLTASETKAVVAGWAEAWGEDELNLTYRELRLWHLLQNTLQQVYEGVRRHSAESLLRRLRTGLDALPEAAKELVLPREERARRLLDELGADEEHAGLARVVRDLRAALRLPRALAQADETAAEGVADIGNRGPLDRLILSELAHDDLTLAARVALNEALYLRREPPAQRPQRALAVLLDTGVRMWGVPRVLGTAAALALVSRHERGGETAVWRAEGRTLAQADLLTKTGLENQLAALGTDAHPGAALPAFAAAVAELGETDAVIVTHRDALAEVALQVQLARLDWDRGFLLLVERDGGVQLHALPWGAPRPVAEARVDVEKLFPRPKARGTATTLIDPGAAGDWPAIFRERPFPLLLPVLGKVELGMQLGAGGQAVIADRRLLQWSKAGLGARQIATNLPPGRVCWLHADEAGRSIVVLGRDKSGRMSVVLAAADGSEPQVVRFTGPQHPQAAWVNRQVVLVALHSRVVAVTLATAEVVAETPFPAGVKWLNQRYFTSPDGVSFAAWDGTAVRWDKTLNGGQAVKTEEVLTAFDREGIGAWVLLRDGRLLSPTGQEAMKTGFPLVSAVVLENGERIAVASGGGRSMRWHNMYLKTKHIASVTAEAAAAPARLMPPTRNLQSRFAVIWAAPGQPLRLRKSNPGTARWLELFLNPDGSLQLAKAAEREEVLEAEGRRFAPVMTPATLGCQLQIARWPDGSAAWLDSRGLLHLRSSETGVPEVTLVLNQGALAGWSSDGERGGPDFFHGQGVRDGLEGMKKIHAAITQFCAGIRP